MTTQDASPLYDLDRACPHEHFETWSVVNRLTLEDDEPVFAYAAEVRINCTDCSEPFRFIGVQAGLRPDRPTCSVDETELRVPIRPASSDPDFGLGSPGFAIRYREEDL